MTKNKINRAIKHLGLEIVSTRGDGYFYFVDLVTDTQVGELVSICYLNQLTLDRWLAEAQHANKSRL